MTPLARMVVALSCLVGCPSSKPSVGADVPKPDSAANEGRRLYDKYCALCHAEGGVGYAADNASALSNQEFLATASDVFLYTAIQNGRTDTAMAAYSEELGGPLDGPQMRLIISYLRSLQTVESVAVEDQVVDGDAQAAEPLYAKQCAHCHGAKGEGVDAISLSNPMFLASASDGFVRHAIAKGRPGTPMPAFEGELSPADIDNLTRLIRSWARNVDSSSPAGEVPPEFEEVVVNPKGPRPEFSALIDGRYVPADEVKRELDRGARMIFVDARPTSDWLRSHIPGALPFPYYDSGKMIDSLPNDDTWIIAYCACPHAASGKVMDMLRAKGFKNTAVLNEGILTWTARRYPLTFGATP